MSLPKAEEEAAKSTSEEKSDSADAEEEEEELSEYEKFINSLCIIQENQWNKGEMLINMAVMAVVGSTYVNGVAAIHSDIIKNQLFSEYDKIFPDKFQNKTNGVTPRRWLAFCNPGLSELITETLGTDAWINDMSLLTVSTSPPCLHLHWPSIPAILGLLLPQEMLLMGIEASCGSFAGLGYA